MYRKSFYFSEQARTPLLHRFLNGKHVEQAFDTSSFPGVKNDQLDAWSFAEALRVALKNQLSEYQTDRRTFRVSS
jgi:hypothetical protein